MIEIINSEFVPVWINIRKTPLPRRAWVKDVLMLASLDGENRIADLANQGFFVRSVVLAPDTETLLNRNPSKLAAAFGQFVMGDLQYAEVNPGDYLSMLRRSLEKFRADFKH